jgi:hypothetical protein
MESAEQGEEKYQVRVQTLEWFKDEAEKSLNKYDSKWYELLNQKWEATEL